MTDIDTSILDELSRRNRRRALVERGRSVGVRVSSPPRPLGRRKPKPRAKTRETFEQRQARTAAARAARQAKVESNRERELDELAEALLTIVTRLHAEGYRVAEPDVVQRLRYLSDNLPTDEDAAICREAADEIERLRREAA